MSRRDEVLAGLDAIQQRDRKVAEAAAAGPAAAPLDPQESVRQTLDLALDLHLDLQRWRLDVSTIVGRTVTQHEVVHTAIEALVRDETVGRRVRALLAAGRPVPRTRRRRAS